MVQPVLQVILTHHKVEGTPDCSHIPLLILHIVVSPFHPNTILLPNMNAKTLSPVFALFGYFYVFDGPRQLRE